MNSLHPVFAVAVYLAAFLTAYFINKKFRLPNDASRFETIDGLRGFLAVGVLIHHAAIWLQYLQTGHWSIPTSNFYVHLGQTSVSFFFMITAFLFVSKLLNAKGKKPDWNVFFLSRFFRLVPMYLVSIAVLILIVFLLSDWRLQVSGRQLLSELFAWTTFTIPADPTINDSAYTHKINAGVVWSLPYEWLFYFCLPIIAVAFTRQLSAKMYILLGLLFIYLFNKSHGIDLHHIASFAGGAIAPFLIKYAPKKINFNSIAASLVVVLCLVGILFFSTPNNYVCKLLIAIVFNLVALGNSLFGMLRSKTLKLLGEISYSTYLLHGIFIFVTMYFGFGLNTAAGLSVIEFWLTIILLTPVIISTSFLTYRMVEKPFMTYAKSINISKIRERIISLRTKPRLNRTYEPGAPVRS